ncbi:hypothetical protein KKG36_00990 [Patescibacteria group bacterium]|nr:hypothetical protein [Patescibacteria group bacterium]
MKIQNISDMESLLEGGDYESILPGPKNSDRVHQSLELKNRFPLVSGEVTRILGVLNTDIDNFRACRRCCDVVHASVERDYGNAFASFARKVAWEQFRDNYFNRKLTPFRFPLARKMLRLPPRKILSDIVAVVEAWLANISKVEWRSSERFVTLSKPKHDCKKCGGSGKDGKTRCVCVSDVTGQLPNPLPSKAKKKFFIKLSDAGYCWLVFK